MCGSCGSDVCVRQGVARHAWVIGAFPFWGSGLIYFELHRLRLFWEVGSFLRFALVGITGPVNVHIYLYRTWNVCLYLRVQQNTINIILLCLLSFASSPRLIHDFTSLYFPRLTLQLHSTYIVLELPVLPELSQQIPSKLTSIKLLNSEISGIPPQSSPFPRHRRSWFPTTPGSKCRIPSLHKLRIGLICPPSRSHPFASLLSFCSPATVSRILPRLRSTKLNLFQHSKHFSHELPWHP